MTPPGADGSVARRWPLVKGAVVACGAAVLVLALTAAPELLPAAYLDALGATAQGEVTGKREVIELRGAGEWRHVFEVSYRFRPASSQPPETGRQSTDAALFSRLAIGSPVDVRYSRSAWVRSWLPRAGSGLAGSSWLAPLREDSDRRRTVVEWLGIGIVALLWLGAALTPSRRLAVAAGVGTATIFSAILLFGFLVLPLGFAAWRRRPGRGFGWALAWTIVLFTGVTAARIPWPTPQAPGRLMEATALVRNQRRVDEIWKPSSRRAGQSIRQLYDLVDLEFTPEGSDVPVHALDRVDAGSVPGLAAGSTIPVVYPASDPRTARVRGASREYARDAFVYVMGLTFGLAAILTFVVYPLIVLVDRRVRSSALRRIVGASVSRENRS